MGYVVKADEAHSCIALRQLDVICDSADALSVQLIFCVACTIMQAIQDESNNTTEQAKEDKASTETPPHQGMLCSLSGLARHGGASAHPCRGVMH
jgi:hypothetical protein